MLFLKRTLFFFLYAASLAVLVSAIMAALYFVRKAAVQMWYVSVFDMEHQVLTQGIFAMFGIMLLCALILLLSKWFINRTH